MLGVATFTAYFFLILVLLEILQSDIGYHFGYNKLPKGVISERPFFEEKTFQVHLFTSANYFLLPC